MSASYKPGCRQPVTGATLSAATMAFSGLPLAMTRELGGRDGDMNPDNPNGFALAVMLAVTTSGNDQGKGMEIVRGHARCLPVFEYGQGKRRRPVRGDRAMMLPHLNRGVANMRRAQSCSAS